MPEATIAIGKKAPAFTLPDQDGRGVRLADLKGRWVVVYFYPKDDTPGCTTEACEFSAGLGRFEKLDATVLGCSPDGAEAHRRFRRKHGLRLTLLSDETHRVMKRYGAWGMKSLYGRRFEGVIRSTVLIDPAGKVAHHWAKVKAAGHAEQVRLRLEELKTA